MALSTTSHLGRALSPAEVQLSQFAPAAGNPLEFIVNGYADTLGSVSGIENLSVSANPLTQTVYINGILNTGQLTAMPIDRIP